MKSACIRNMYIMVRKDSNIIIIKKNISVIDKRNLKRKKIGPKRM